MRYLQISQKGNKKWTWQTKSYELAKDNYNVEAPWIKIQSCKRSCPTGTIEAVLNELQSDEDKIKNINLGNNWYNKPNPVSIDNDNNQLW